MDSSSSPSSPSSPASRSSQPDDHDSSRCGMRASIDPVDDLDPSPRRNSFADISCNNDPAQLGSSLLTPGLNDNQTLDLGGSPDMLDSQPQPQDQEQETTAATHTDNTPPLSTIYLQIEYATTPFAVLGVQTDASSREIRSKYLDLALRIHPDKTPDDHLRELHTPLFQKVRAAYQEILELHLGNEGSSPKHLPESAASLHARNVAFREALRKERERVITAKHIADKLQADKQARLQAKNERLAEHRRARAEAALMKLKKQREKQEDEQREKQRVKQRDNARLTSEHVTNGEEREKGPRSTKARKEEVELSDWETQEDQLAALAREKEALEKERPLRSTPTNTTARPLWDPSLDEPLACKAEIRSRWDKKLLSGGTSGSVSFSEKKQRENNAQARLHRLSLALVEEADRLIKPALTGCGSHWFSGLAEEELLQRAFVETEMLGEMRMEWLLRELDVDVRERYLLGEERLGSVQVGLLEFVVGGEQVLLLEDGGCGGV